MKNLAALMDRLEAGKADIVQEKVDTALGIWAAAHNAAHKIITISESSVAFTDDKDVLWAARYTISEGDRVVITGMKPVMNITEEASKTDWLEPLCEEIVSLVAEDDEASAAKIIGAIMEAKYKAIRAGKLTRINDPIVRKRNFRKMDMGFRWNIIKAARRTAKRTALKPAKALRLARSMKRRKSLGLDKGAGPTSVAGHSAANLNEAEGKNGYICGFKGKKFECYADTLSDAKNKAKAHFKPSKKDAGLLWVELAEKGGKPVEKTLSESVREALTDLPGIAINLMTAQIASRKRPVIEGHILERDEDGNVLSYIPKNTTKVVAINERYYTTGDGIAVPADTVKVKGGKDDEFVPAGQYDIKSMNPRSTILCQRGENGKHPTFKCSTSALKSLKKAAAKAKATEEKPVEEGEGTQKVLKAEPAVIVQLGALTEAKVDDKDFFLAFAASWENFRSSPISEDAISALKTLTTEKVDEVAKILADKSSFLTLCTEEEVYEAIAPHCDAFDPSVIKAVAKTVVEHGQTEEAMAERNDFLARFNDKRLVEELTDGRLPVSEALDTLFLEGDQFDFGSADDLGSDDLDDDMNDEDMDDDLDDEDLDDEGDELDDYDDGQDERIIQVELNVDDLRDDMNTILDVIGDEIEDNDEFDELRAKFEDEEEEVEAEDVVRLLQVIGDYFNAVAEERNRSEEEEAESEMDEEDLDDMDDMGGDDEDLEGEDPEGVGGEDDMGGADDDLELGA